MTKRRITNESMQANCKSLLPTFLQIQSPSLITRPTAEQLPQVTCHHFQWITQISLQPSFPTLTIPVPNSSRLSMGPVSQTRPARDAGTVSANLHLSPSPSLQSHFRICGRPPAAAAYAFSLPHSLRSPRSSLPAFLPTHLVIPGPQVQWAFTGTQAAKPLEKQVGQ